MMERWCGVQNTLSTRFMRSTFLYTLAGLLVLPGQFTCASACEVTCMAEKKIKVEGSAKSAWKHVTVDPQPSMSRLRSDYGCEA